MENNTNSYAPIRINFNPRDWEFYAEHKHIGSRSFITDFTGKLVECYTIGDWSRNLTAIIRYLRLDKHTDYVFSFWLNGGENDRYQEVCKFEIMFDEPESPYEMKHVRYASRFSYNLNRSFIKYEMHYKGWYLYEIPFNTGDNEYTRLNFSCMDAPCTIIPAREKSYYENLQPDEPRTDLPQRSNLVYPNGYPTDASWSWKVFGKNDAQNNRNFSDFSKFDKFDNFDFNEEIRSRIDIDTLIEEIVEDVVDDARYELEERLKDQLKNGK
ncbi:MAG: hypothetical protein FWC32_14155 [Firmicutes bacterium]|nr:hypothetical protein [Bacillota bacterium]